VTGIASAASAAHVSNIRQNNRQGCMDHMEGTVDRLLAIDRRPVEQSAAINLGTNFREVELPEISY